MKALIKKILFFKPVAKVLVDWLLRLNNFSYAYAGVFSQALEPNSLHPKHRLMNYHQWFADQIDSDWTVLDIGCGNGALAFDLQKKCRELVGIDLNLKNVEKARKMVPGATFIHGDATSYPFSQRFDAVVLSNVLEHIDKRVDFLSKLSKLSNRFLIRVPMIDRDWITPYKKERGIEYRLDQTHFIEYTLDGFEKELSDASLNIRSVHIRFGELYAVVDLRV
jgi:SAM-dependent methyltransferase